MIIKAKHFKTLRFSLAGNKKRFLDQFCTYIFLVYSIEFKNA
jgi:hypothetical protein